MFFFFSSSSFFDFIDYSQIVLDEMKRFRQSLVEMFSSVGKSVVFMETCCESKQNGTHTFIECIPVDNEVMETLPIIFKVSLFLSPLLTFVSSILSLVFFLSTNSPSLFLFLFFLFFLSPKLFSLIPSSLFRKTKTLQADLEKQGPTWAQHRKVIDVKESVYTSLPADGVFDYFFVLFDGEQGYAHIIEDSTNFARDYRDYGKSVVGEVLGLTPDAWRDVRGQHARFTDEENGRVVSFLKLYEPFDWTRALDA